MRYIEGETLQAAIERFHAETPRGQADSPGFQHLLSAIIDSAYAVAYAHSRGVIHRDIKPQNIMLGPFGETLVMDWGAAKVIAADDAFPTVCGNDAEADLALTDPGSLIGTPLYMSPEQADRDHDRVGPASDVYAARRQTLYAALAGKPAFSGGRRRKTCWSAFARESSPRPERSNEPRIPRSRRSA